MSRYHVHMVIVLSSNVIHFKIFVVYSIFEILNSKCDEELIIRKVMLKPYLSSTHICVKNNYV